MFIGSLTYSAINSIDIHTLNQKFVSKAQKKKNRDRYIELFFQMQRSKYILEYFVKTAWNLKAF